MIRLNENLSSEKLMDMAYDIYDYLLQTYSNKEIVLSCVGDMWDYDVVLNGFEDICSGVSGMLNGKYSSVNLSEVDIKSLNLALVEIILDEFGIK